MKQSILVIGLFITLIGCKALFPDSAQPPCETPSLPALPSQSLSFEARGVLTPTLIALTPSPFSVKATSTSSPTVNSPAYPQSTPTILPAPPELSDIQDTLDIYIQALNENRPELLDQAVDPNNKPFKRLVRSRFDSYQESMWAGMSEPALEVRSIEEKPHGYYQACLTSDDGLAGEWTFKKVGDRWLLSEPTVEEIGEPEEITSEHFTFITYPWAGEINSEVIDLMEQAREKVVQTLGKAPEAQAQVRIRPIYGLDPYSPMDAGAYYRQANERWPNQIVIFSPHSFAFGLYDREAGWQDHLEAILIHEYTHMTHALSFDNAGARLLPWMSEGLAEYVSEADHDLEIACYAAHSGVVIPLVDRENIIHKQDLAHMRSLEIDQGLAYAYAYTVVAYIVEKYGGLDGFWKLATTFDRVQDMDEALQEAFGVSLDQFEREWIEWVKAGC